ncbi:helix-turn-helix transcriptional regulator [Chthonobacter rhizosphaerae]|uniref:helix-turn-helix transcriptional regulator n=1 Tax=Chthonobacter rhizosphaerae TaxID=2735553 RepID=UPI0015EFC3D9|nr:helix-turn-helix transcriptional regulator [Chthonobacter rhizosphaerae]
MRSTTHNLSEDLLEAIYACALAPERWPATLQSVCDAVGADAAALVVHDQTSRTASAVNAASTDPILARDYCERFARLNPHLAHIRTNPLEGRVTTSLTALEPARFRGSRFYEEWCRPSGIHELAIAELARTPTHLGTLGFARADAAGPFDLEAVEVLEAYAPHLGRAARLSALVREERAAADALGAMVERLAVATLVVNAAGRVVRANVAGERLIEEGRMLTARDRRIRFADPKADATVQRMVSGRGGLPVFVVARDVGGTARLVTVMPPSEETGGLAVVLVGRAQSQPADTDRIMTDVFGLTAAENRVLGLLVGGLSPTEAADRLGLSIATVRTHIRRVLDKTGTSRQADLMCVVHRVVPPLTLE